MSFWKQSDMPSSGKRVLGGMNERMRYESAQWVNTFWRQKSEIYGNVVSPFLNQIVTTLLFCDPKRPEEGENESHFNKISTVCCREQTMRGEREKPIFFWNMKSFTCVQYASRLFFCFAWLWRFTWYSHDICQLLCFAMSVIDLK